MGQSGPRPPPDGGKASIAISPPSPEPGLIPSSTAIQWAYLRSGDVNQLTFAMLRELEAARVSQLVHAGAAARAERSPCARRRPGSSWAPSNDQLRGRHRLRQPRSQG